jgi:hypothetical protein
VLSVTQGVELELTARRPGGPPQPRTLVTVDEPLLDDDVRSGG